MADPESPNPHPIRRPAERAHSGWAFAGPATVAALAIILAVFHDTGAAIVRTWMQDKSFTHGLLVPPVVMFLIWRRRDQFLPLAPRPSAWGFAGLAAAVLLWILGLSARLQFVEQYGLAAMLVATVVAVLGVAVSRTLLFPLAFLFLAVPSGEVLVPPLMDFTASFAVRALQWIGIPVVREGILIKVPNGAWVVAEACSGFRYLMASVTLSALFAYIAYRSALRRALFMGLALIVPVFANGARASLIILLGYLSEMKLARGTDHYIYGWIFFSAVMALLFWIGSLWREPPAGRAAPTPGGEPPPSPRVSRGGGIVAVRSAALAVILCSAGAWASSGFNRPKPPGPITIRPPTVGGGWQMEPGTFTDWRPAYHDPDLTLFQEYRRGRATAGLCIVYYADQQQGKELVHTLNELVSSRSRTWHVANQGLVDEPIRSGVFPVRRTLLQCEGQGMVAWDFYWVAGRFTRSSLLAKLLGAASRLRGVRDEAALVVMCAPVESGGPDADASLRDFLPRAILLLDQALRASHARSRS